MWMQGRMAEKDFPTIRKFLYSLNDILKRILLFPLPVICAINGPSIGVGLTMTMACDIRIASENARLGMRFVRIGVAGPANEARAYRV
jgi:enoyl-CoA hydratase/carnithine racemase